MISIDMGIEDYTGIYLFTITNDPKVNNLFTRERIFWFMSQDFRC